MTSFLLFTLYAPLSSWGEIAVGESRGSWERPSRSAVLGLLGAALGIDRGDQEAHDALDSGFGIAVCASAIGTSLVDYHTTQVATARTVKALRQSGHPVTRRTLLEGGEPETILSRRVYRQDALYTVCLWGQGAEGTRRWSVDGLRLALERPAYVLYAGRKSNPLGLPLAAQVLAADSLASALAARLAHDSLVAQMFGSRLKWSAPHSCEVAHDPCDGFTSGLQPLRRETRRDTAPHRARWHFSERTVEIGLLPRSASEVAS